MLRDLVEFVVRAFLERSRGLNHGDDFRLKTVEKLLQLLQLIRGA